MALFSKLIPVLFLGFGTCAGIAGALMTAQDTQPFAKPEIEDPSPAADAQMAVDDVDYVKLNNQFVVPVVQEGLVSALVLVSLGLETTPGTAELVYNWEPKLRDVFLQVLFDFANIGGFQGVFTAPSNLNTLRSALRGAAQKEFGDSVLDVLIFDIARQDV